ncbi:hypothetical protein [Thioalkalivibrio sp. AKL6]|uniref:hypothetical protein n=1 Tax=Thioalkalivibrio sp. AKL6 TaxID=1158154 RepID=UPI00036E1E7E|nr:hypothetical protein [Thioalkalivibrio sp. AKL6]
MFWLIAYVIALIAAAGILSERSRAPVRARVLFALAVLAVPFVLQTFGWMLLGDEPHDLIAAQLGLLSYVIGPILVAWYFLYRYPLPASARHAPKLKSFRLAIGAWHRHILILGFMAFVVVGMGATYNPLTQWAYDRVGQHNLENEVVRAKLADQHFDIPMRYFVIDAYVPRGYWPRAKNRRVDVGALSIYVLLPDLRPFYPEEKHLWNLEGGGRGDRVRVTIWEDDFSKSNVKTLRARAAESGEPLAPETAKTYGVDRHNEDVEALLYARRLRLFPRDESEAWFITCASPKDVPSPSCRMKTAFRPGIALEKTFGLEYLPDWRRIATKSERLVDSLAVEGANP